MVDLAMLLDDFADGLIDRLRFGNIGVMSSDFRAPSTELFIVHLSVKNSIVDLLLCVRIFLVDHIHQDLRLPLPLLL